MWRLEGAERQRPRDVQELWCGLLGDVAQTWQLLARRSKVSGETGASLDTHPETHRDGEAPWQVKPSPVPFLHGGPVNY